MAPATASSIARLASGLSEDVLTATVLAARIPVLIAPAMHTEMWEHPATQRNINRIRDDGHHIVGPAVGALAGGDEGVGRLVEPEDIVNRAASLLSGDLAGWTVLVSSGGTREAIDPVRFIGNRSSGKMGNEIADEAARRGARVLLVSSAPGLVSAAVEVTRVESAQEMAEAVWSRAPQADVVVLAAAVADFRPSDASSEKLRRKDGLPAFDLEPTPDILAGVATLPGPSVSRRICR